MLTTNPFDDDKLREECGIFGIWGAEGASSFVALGLHALQHRGQEAAGVVSFDGTNYHAHRAMGHVAGNFDRDDIIRKLSGKVAIGHVRYSTTGETALRNVQPLFADLAEGGFAVAHNGNLSNAMTLRAALIRRGSIFQSTSDTEVIIHLVATSSYTTPLDRLTDALGQVEGAYSLLCLTPEGLVACRDPLGIRPLVMGKLGEATIFASETVALDVIGATYLRDVEPGELIIVNETGVRSFRPFAPAKARPCIFEHVYFARPDSIVDGTSVYEVRKNIGAELAREAPVEADLVVPVPDSGVPAAIGFSQESHIPFELGIIRSHYVGRTFIQPSQEVRHLGVKLKHNANRALIEGKRVVLIDDSIVRGTTSVKIVQMMRDAGAREVHMRIASPPTKFSCFYGVDTPERSKLLASQMNVDEMARYINADSLAFITIDGLYRALGDQRDATVPQRCDACFTGNYPTTLTDCDKDGKLALVTGASRGIGAATAEALAAAGAHVILTARGASALEQVEERIHQAGGTATIAPMDLNDSENIGKLAQAVAERWGSLDIMVLNAAMLGSLSPVEHLDAKELEKVFKLNVLANQAMIAAFDPLLRRAEKADVIGITSSVGEEPRAFWGGYGASKAAFDTLLGAYADETAYAGKLRVQIVDPGSTRTRMRQLAFPGEEPESVKPPETVAAAILDRLQGDAETGSRFRVDAQ